MPDIPRAVAHIPILKGAIILALYWHAGLNLNVGLEQPIANGAKRTVLPGGGGKQVSLSRRVLPRGPYLQLI